MVTRLSKREVEKENSNSGSLTSEEIEQEWFAWRDDMDNMLRETKKEMKDAEGKEFERLKEKAERLKKIIKEYDPDNYYRRDWEVKILDFFRKKTQKHLTDIKECDILMVCPIGQNSNQERGLK